MSLTQPTGSSSGTPGYGANGPPGSGSTTYSSGGSAPSGQQDTAATPDKTSGSPLTLFGWLLGWSVFIFFLWLLTRSRTGYALVYYGAWAALILLLLTQYRWFVAVLAPVSGLVVQPPATSSGSTSGGAASSGGGGAGGSF